VEKRGKTCKAKVTLGKPDPIYSRCRVEKRPVKIGKSQKNKVEKASKKPNAIGKIVDKKKKKKIKNRKVLPRVTFQLGGGRSGKGRLF